MFGKTRLSLPSLFTRALFRAGAKPMTLALNGQPLGDAAPKEFTTGSLGWGLSTKIQVTIDGVTVWAQVNLNVAVLSSSKLPK